MFRLVCTGSRYYSYPLVVTRWLDAFWQDHTPEGLTVVHGGCRTGFDNIVSVWAQNLIQARPHKPIVEEVYPADWAAFGPVAGPRRNQQMVSLGAHGALVGLIEGLKCAGTVDCLRRIKDKNIQHKVLLLPKDLHISIERSKRKKNHTVQ